MLKSIALSVSLLLVASPLQAQLFSPSEERLRGVYSQLGFDIGYHFCEGLKSGNYSINDFDRMTAYLNGRLTIGELELMQVVLAMPEDNVYREVFQFNLWRSLKYGGCESFMN